MKFDHNCIKCLVSKNLNVSDFDIDDKLKMAYLKEVLFLISQSDADAYAPEIVESITDLQLKYGIKGFDYTDVKKHYNQLLLSFEEKIFKSIESSEDPIYKAVCYAFVGNYIDFGTNLNINEQKLNTLIDNVASVSFDVDEFVNLKNDLSTAKSLVYLTDNCGEIVFDKLLISTIKKCYKNIDIKVIVRGRPVLNDATMDDAIQVGLDKIVDVCDNGTGVAGTVLGRINEQSSALINRADVIISKGMGNFETLNGCGKNIYYMFMCKCEKFCSVFNVPLLTNMLLNDKRIAE